MRGSLVRMYLTHCLPCPHSPLLQVPSRCTTEPSNSFSVSLGPSSRLHLQGMEWAGGHRWDFPQPPTLHSTLHVHKSHPPLSALLSTCLCTLILPQPLSSHIRNPTGMSPVPQPPITLTSQTLCTHACASPMGSHQPPRVCMSRCQHTMGVHLTYTRTLCTHALHPSTHPVYTPRPGRASPRAAAAAAAALPLPAMAAPPRLRRAAPPASGAGGRGHRAAEARAEGPARRCGTAGSGGPGMSPAGESPRGCPGGPGGHREGAPGLALWEGGPGGFVLGLRWGGGQGGGPA